MPLFSYKAQDQFGKIVEDTVQASTKEEAASALAARGLVLLTLKAPQKSVSLFERSISVSEKASFARFMGTMLRSGMGIPEAVDIIREETKSKKLTKVLSDISYQTRKGKSLSSVLSDHPNDFDPVFLTMIKAGEESGNLDESFDYLAEQLSGSHELAQKIKGSLMYPAVIIMAMIGNGILMGVFVLPRIAESFLKLDFPLPVYTTLILNLGQFLGNNSLLFIIFVVLTIAFSFALLFIGRTRAVILRSLQIVPAVKNVINAIDIARFTRTLSTLLRSGVPIVQALDVSADSITQEKLKKKAKGFGEFVEKGQSLSDMLTSNRNVFPGVVVQSIKAGETSGSLEKVLAEVAIFYEKEVDFSLKRLTALLEPALMLFIGVVVGVMVIMMIAPIYSIIGGLQTSIQGQ